jgi:uncharacterized protein (DUF4415 family)
MSTVVVTILHIPGCLNVHYKKFYSFKLDEKYVKIYLHRRNKGLRIQDSTNKILRLANKTALNKPLTEFTGGYIIELGVQDKEGIPVNKYDFLYILEHGEADRDVFVIEQFFTEMVLFVEFEKFEKSVFDNEETRKGYNRSIFKAYNHFATKYVLASSHGMLDELPINGESSSLSFSLKQAHFEKKGALTDEEYLKRTSALPFTRTSVVVEQVGRSGMTGASEDQIDELSRNFKNSIREKLRIEDSFLASALVELSKQHHKFALLEAFIAVEGVVERCLIEKRKGTNVSQRVIDDFKRETGIGYQTNIEIPLALGKVDDAYIKLVENLNGVRRTRNKIVHDGLSIDYSVAADAIAVCTKYIQFLQSKMA